MVLHVRSTTFCMIFYCFKMIFRHGNKFCMIWESFVWKVQFCKSVKMSPWLSFVPYYFVSLQIPFKYKTCVWNSGNTFWLSWAGLGYFIVQIAPKLTAQLNLHLTQFELDCPGNGLDHPTHHPFHPWKWKKFRFDFLSNLWSYLAQIWNLS